MDTIHPNANLQTGTSVSGHIFHDVNGDSTRAVHDVGLNEWTVYDDVNDNRQFDAGEPFSVTSDGGKWRIGNLGAGTHFLRVAIQDGWRQSSAIYGREEIVIVTAGAAVEIVGNEFLVTQVPLITGQIFQDNNNDGVMDENEPSFTSRRVYADLNNNGIFESNTEPFVLAGTPGFYKFSGLTPGTQYTLRVEAPPGRTLIQPAAGFHVLTPMEGEILAGRDFRYRDSQGPTVKFTVAGGALVNSTTGGVRVEYADNWRMDPTSLGAGDLRITGPSGYSQLVTGGTLGYQSPQATTASVNYTYTPPGGTWDASDNGTYTVELVAGQVADASGNTSPVQNLASFTVTLSPSASYTIAGTVFNDISPNGGFETGTENAIAGRTVYIDANNNGVFDAGERSTTSIIPSSPYAAGYVFNGVAPGSYTVRTILPTSDVIQTWPELNKGVTVVFGTGSSREQRVDFGTVQLATGSIVSTGVFGDDNADGQPDERNPLSPIPDNSGWIVYRDANQNGALDSGEQSAVSDQFGYAPLFGVPAGTHQFRVAPKAGKEFTVPSGGMKLINVPARATVQDAGFGVRNATTTVPTTPVTLRALADAFVRDGIAASTNYGTGAELQSKTSTSIGSSRETYLKFDLSSAASVANAKLRLYGQIGSTTQQAQIAVFGVSNTTWGETTINWNNRPAATGAAIATQTISGNTPKWYEFDLTSYLAAEKSAGRNTVTLLVRSLTTGVDPYIGFTSDEASANRPELVVTPNGGTTPPPTPGIVLSTSQLTVPEGSSASVGVKLAAQPTSNLVVTIARSSGDGDLSANFSTLTFTPANWNIVQNVSIAAAQDADTSNGAATFSFSAAGAPVQTLTATEADDDTVAPPPGGTPVTVRAVADTYVRDGSSAGQNFGIATDLVVKKTTIASGTRETYLRFAISDFPSISAAKLRLFGRSNTSTQSVPMTLFGVTNTTWSETGTNWNNKPVTGLTVLGPTIVAGTTSKWYEFDMTAYLQQQKAAGATAVTFVLRGNGTTDAQALFTSDESTTAANRPQLVVTPGPSGPPPQALIVSATQLSVPEGGFVPFTIKLAAAPASDVVVNLARSSGDTDMGLSTLSLRFTADDWNVPQTINLSAAADLDALNGSAIFTISATGLPSKTITATEIDDDAPAVPSVVRATADAYVRDGSYVSQNFGASGELLVNRSNTLSNTREGYLRFNIDQMEGITNAKLRLFGRSTSSTQPVGVTLQESLDTTWSETSLTWNNKPRAGYTIGSTHGIVGTTGQWYEWDLTQYVQQRKNAGATDITLVLSPEFITDAQAVFASDEAAGNRPELVLTPGIPPQDLVIISPNLPVPEGGTQAYAVRLAVQPTSNVLVSAFRLSGDPDLDSSGSLLFTPANWNVSQAMNITAAEDADTTNGTARFRFNAYSVGYVTNLSITKDVTATELDNDAPAEPITLRAAADAYVRDGSSAGQNFGSVTELVVKRNTIASGTRESYLRFSISDFSSANSAVLRLFGRSNTSGQSIPVSVYGATDVAWSEGGINWNTKPVAGAAALASKSISSTTNAWQEFDVTAYVQEQRAAGATSVTFVLKSTTNGDAQASFNSDEAAANQPQLVVTPNSGPAPQALVLSTSQLAVNEDGSASFTVKLATQPTSDVIVTVSRTSGDADLLVTNPTNQLLFTAANWNVPQTIELGANDDVDSLNGSAVFTVFAAGLPSKTLTATEIDDDAPIGPTVLRAITDAYVRDGSYAATNYGTATQLQLKKGQAGWNREAALRFDIASVASPLSSAKLRLYGKVSDTSAASLDFSVFGSTNTSWNESTVNWNNRPLSTGVALASGTVSGSAGKWYELDLTSYLQEQKAAGASSVTLVLKTTTASDAAIFFDSDEAANRPELLVMP